MHWTVHLTGGPRRVNHAAAAVGDLIFSFGGYCTDTGDVHTYWVKQPIDVHVLNTINLKWRQLPKPSRSSSQYAHTPYQRYGHTVLAYGKKIYLWGGRNDEAACNLLYEFDTETYLWSLKMTSGTTPSSRDGHSACIIGHHMYIFGGFEEEFQRYSQDVYALNLRTMHWSYVITHGAQPYFCDFHTGTAIGTRMYIFGGRSDHGGPHSSEEDYYPNIITYLETTTMTWHRPKTYGSVPIGRRSHSAFVYEDSLHIFGGYNSVVQEHFNDMHRFCPKTNTWTEISTIGLRPNKRRRQVCIVIDNRMFLFGGTSPNTSIKTELVSDHPDPKLIDHDDLHILDFKPTLKTLSMLAVVNHELTDAFLPEDIKWELKVTTANKWQPSNSMI